MTTKIDLLDIETVWKAGLVRRWHANPDMAHIEDLNCAHMGRCAVLALKLFPRLINFNLLVSLITHDLGERIVGDIPYTARHHAWTKDMDISESDALAAMGFSHKDSLPPLQTRILNFVDRLDAYLFVKHRAPHILIDDGWPEQILWLQKEWTELGAEGDMAPLLP